MGTGLGNITGFTVTNRGDIQRTFDIGGVDLTINGTLTVDCTTGQLRNNATTNALKVLSTGSASAELIFTGRKVAANNGPFPYDGLDWLGVNGAKIMQLQGTATYPAKLTLRDACIRYGADWITTNSGQFSTITTEGEICWILCGNGQGTNQARLRMDNSTASVNFTAKKTYVGVWLNFGVPQTSLKGYTPLNTDGPEINMASVSVAQRVPIEDYDTSYVVPNYYANSQIVLLGGAWVRLINNLRGTNINYFSQNASAAAENIIEFSRRIVGTAKDSAGTSLSDGTLYYQPVGANVTNIRPKGVTTDVTFNLSQQVATFTAGSATSEFVYAWGYDATGGVKTSYSYFCTGTTRGAETQTVFSSRYGYDKQSSVVLLAGNGDAVPSFVHASLPTTDKVIANAAAITGVAFNFGTKTITLSASRTIQQVYDAYQYQLNQTANLQQPNECTVANGRTNYVGWTLIVNSGVTLSEGGNFTEIQANTVTNNGTITAIYVSSAGSSTTFRFEDVAVGSSLVIYDASGVTKYFQGSVTTAGDYNYYIPPGTTGTYSWAIEQYGKQRQSGSFAANTGGLLFYSPIYIEDVGITQTTQATVAGYSTLETNSKLYDYVAYFRLSEQGIKLGQIATRSGTSIEFGSYSGIIKSTHTSVLSITGSTITIKANGLAGDTKFSTIIATPPATWTAFSTEVITTEIEDGNGDSSLTISAAAVSTFQIWKITDATNADDYATGTLVATVGIGKYRFLAANGFKFVVRDTVTNYRVVVEAEKGTYKAELFFGAAVQLAQAAEVSQINTKVDIMAIDLDAIKGTGFLKNKHSLTNIKKKAALAAALSA